MLLVVGTAAGHVPITAHYAPTSILIANRDAHPAGVSWSERGEDEHLTSTRPIVIEIGTGGWKSLATFVQALSIVGCSAFKRGAQSYGTSKNFIL